MSENATLSALDSYLQENRGRFLENLKAALRIPSVSSQSEHKADVQRCAEHIAAHLKRIGMTDGDLQGIEQASGGVLTVTLSQATMAGSVPRYTEPALMPHSSALGRRWKLCLACSVRL